MAFEPINIFSSRVDPAGVARLARSLFPDARIEGEDEDWTRITIEVQGRTLSLGHNREYYAGPGWPSQQSGMQSYFARFPDAPGKLESLRLIRTFAFSLSVPTDDLDLLSDDPRVKVLHRVCRFVDGVFFTPSALRDADGRVLVDVVGSGADEDVVWPGFPSEESIVDLRYELEPPTAERVARRALALTAVAGRATLEREFEEGTLADATDAHAELLGWLADTTIASELEPAEQALINTPIGDLGPRAFIEAVWRVEGLVTLAWALGLHAMPRYDRLVNLTSIFQAMGLLRATISKQLLVAPHLRSAVELEAMQAQLLAVHWRLRDLGLRPQAMDFVAFSKDCWFGGFDVSRFEIVSDDLALHGVPVADAAADLVASVRSAAQERHLAINWLLGDSEIYSETDIST